MFPLKINIFLCFHFWLFMVSGGNEVNAITIRPLSSIAPEFAAAPQCICMPMEKCNTFTNFIDRSTHSHNMKSLIQMTICRIDGLQIYVCCSTKFSGKRHARERPKLDYLDELTGLNCPPSFGNEVNYDDYLKEHDAKENIDYKEGKHKQHDTNPYYRALCHDWYNCNTFTFPKDRRNSGKPSTTIKFPHQGHQHHHYDHHDAHPYYYPYNKNYHNYHYNQVHNHYPSYFPHKQHGLPNTLHSNTNIKKMETSGGDCGVLPIDFHSGSDIYPWIVRLAYLNTTSRTISYRCLGTIIGDQNILTAAHCVDNLVKDIELIYARLGDDNNFDDYNIINTILHPNYNEPLFNNDIAVIKFDKLRRNTVPFAKICLPRAEQEIRAGKIGVVAGWSSSANDPLKLDTSTVRYINLPIMNNTECAIRYAKYSENFENSIVITPTEFCAQAQTKNDVCEGDSGGPFMDRSNAGRYTQLGLVAFGPKSNCGQSSLPGVYMRISSYVEWIQNNLN